MFTCTCDTATLNLFHDFLGKRLIQAPAQRYSASYLGYMEVVLTFDSGECYRLSLREETLAPKFEVFIVQAHESPPPKLTGEWDLLTLGDFVIDRIFILQRKEGIEKPTDRTIGETVGLNPVVQHFWPTSHRDETGMVACVDSGVCLVSTQGAELLVEADTFPLVFQLRYAAIPSRLPEATRVAVSGAPRHEYHNNCGAQ